MKKNRISKKLIAICGMDCHLCLAYKREKNGCLGCREKIGLRLDFCNRCKIRNCEKAVNGKLLFCFTCESYPCKKIKHIDKRYRTKYRMSMIENFELIKRSGIRKLLINEEEKWACPKCGHILCVHRPHCLYCQYAWR
jgi:hypothetical protein